MKPWVKATMLLLLAGFSLAAMVRCTQPAQPTETPECLPIAMPTGEVYYPVEFQVPLPAQVRAGQTVRIRFTGGMMLLPSGFSCGYEVTVLPPNRSTAQATTRQIALSLGEAVVYSAPCAYDCAMEVVVPPDIPPGAYQWQLDIPWSLMEFPVQVLPPANESSDGS